MKSLFMKVIVWAVCVMGITGAVQAGAGRTGAAFLTLGSGARALAMGEAAVASAEDATALYWNPGSLGVLDGASATMMHESGLGDSRYDQAAYARRTGKGFGWGVGFQYFTVGDMNELNETGDKVGTYRPNDTAATAGIGQSVKGYGVGVAVKVVQSTLVETARTAALDLGMVTPLYMGGRVRAGVSVANIGGQLTFEQESAALPLTARGGLAVSPGKGWTLAVDVLSQRNQDLSVGVGGEYQIHVSSEIRLALRGGYKPGGSNQDADRGVSMGLGFGWKRLDVDYAYGDRGDFDPAQILSVGYRF